MIEEQLELPNFKSLLHQAYMKHEVTMMTDFYTGLLKNGFPNIGRDEFIQQYIDSGLSQQFYETYKNYYGRGKDV